VAKYRYIPMSAVIARVMELVPEERITEKTLYKWVADGVKLVYVSETMQPAVCFARVENYKAKLPSTWRKFLQVLYVDDSCESDTPLEIHLEATNLIPGTKASTNPWYHHTLEETDEELPLVTTDLYASNNPIIGQPVGTYIQGQSQLYTKHRDLRPVNQKWNTLRPSTSRFHTAINCGIDLTRE